MLGSSVDDQNDGGGFAGSKPGVALWDFKGRVIGTTFGSSDNVPEGNFVDVEVVASGAVGDVPAEYLSITAGGNDPICVAGLTATFPDGSQAAWSADVASLCSNITGAKVFLSHDGMTDVDSGKTTKPHCVWITQNHEEGVPHQGFGIHLPDFAGITANRQDSYSANPDLMCRSGPRFRMYEDLRAWDPILTFDPVLESDENGVDLDKTKVINNPGVFADTDIAALRLACQDNFKQPQCTKLPKTMPVVPIIARQARPTNVALHRTHPRDYLPRGRNDTRPSYLYNSTQTSGPAYPLLLPTGPSPPHPTSSQPIPTSAGGHKNKDGGNSTANGARRHRFHGHLVISSKAYHSAQDLCQNPNSWGPSFVSTHDGWFCDMTEKKLHPICAAQDGASNNEPNQTKENQSSCCFDVQQKSLLNCSVNGTVSNEATMAVTRVVDGPSATTSSGTGIYTSVRYW